MAKQTKTEETTAQDGLPDVRPESSSELAIPTAEDMAAAKGMATEVAVANNEAMQTFIQWMVDRADTTDEDQYAVMASILSEIMAADSPEEVMRERSTMRAKDIVGQVLLLHGFEIRQGDYEESMLEHYAAMTVSRPGSDTTRILTCGATKVLMKLYALDRFGEWPQAFYFTAKEGRKGTILDMVRAS